MNKLSFAIIAFLLLTGSGHQSSAGAIQFSSRQFLEACSDNPNFAAGMVVAIIDMTDAAQRNGIVKRNICIPDGVSVGEFLDLSCKFISETMPDLREFPVSGMIAVALEIKFPCRE